MKDTELERAEAAAMSEYYYLKNVKDEEDLRKEYLACSKYFQNLFISKNEYIINTGNFQACNYRLIELVEEAVRKHPHIFKWLFRIA